MAWRCNDLVFAVSGLCKQIQDCMLLVYTTWTKLATLTAGCRRKDGTKAWRLQVINVCPKITGNWLLCNIYSYTSVGYTPRLLFCEGRPTEIPKFSLRNLNEKAWLWSCQRGYLEEGIRIFPNKKKELNNSRLWSWIMGEKILGPGVVWVSLCGGRCGWVFLKAARIGGSDGCQCLVGRNWRGGDRLVMKRCWLRDGTGRGRVLCMPCSKEQKAWCITWS